MKTYFDIFAILPLVLSFSAYGASSVRLLGGSDGSTSVTPAKLADSRAGGLRVGTTNNVGLNNIVAKISSNVSDSKGIDYNNDAQRMSIGRYLGGASISASKSTSSQGITDLSDSLQELTAEVGNLKGQAQGMYDAVNLINSALDGKQDTLIAGKNITITDGVISADVTGATYTQGTSTDLGLTKLYDGVGKNTDGAMTQKAVTDVLYGDTVAVGGNAIAENYGTAVGADAKAGDEVASAFGYKANAVGSAAVATGYMASATDTGAVAVGVMTNASNYGSVAVGPKSSSSGYASIQLGAGSNKHDSSFNVGLGEKDKVSREYISYTLLDKGGVIPAARLTGHDDKGDINGDKGQLLQSNGDGTMSWVEPQGGTGGSGKLYDGMGDANDGAMTQWAVTNILGRDSIAIGAGASAQIPGIAVGLKALAKGSNAIAVGVGAKGDGAESVAIGDNSYAVRDDSVSIGDYAIAEKERSIAMGTKALAQGDSALAFGAGAISSKDYAIQLGAGLNDEANTFNVGLGPGPSYKLLNQDGKIPAERLTGVDTIVDTEGKLLQSNGDGTMSWVAVQGGTGGSGVLYNEMGENTDGAMTQKAVTDILRSDRVVIGNWAGANENSVAVGMGASANTDHSVAIGTKSFAGTAESVAVGEGAYIAGLASTAVGTFANGYGERAVAFGNYAKADGSRAAALGSNAQANGAYSVALGSNAIASAENAFQFGAGTNDQQNTFKIGNYWLLNQDGKIPAERLTGVDTIVDTEGKLLQSNGDGTMSWVAAQGGSSIPGAPTGNGKYKLVWDSNTKQMGWEFEKFSLTCSSGSLDIGFDQCADIAKGRTDRGWYCYEGGQDPRKKDYFGLTEPGTWAAEFDYGVIKGEALCSNTPKPSAGGDYPVGNPSENAGINCWCKMTSPAVSQWVFGDTNYKDANYCSGYCAQKCADLTYWESYRQSLYNSINK